MARRGGRNQTIAVVSFLAGGALLLWLLSGRGRNNSPFIPDAIEDQIDRLVEVLNSAFGKQWVDIGLDALQTHIQRTMPQLAALVQAVYWVESKYRLSRKAGSVKKVAVLGRG